VGTRLHGPDSGIGAADANGRPQAPSSANEMTVTGMRKALTIAQLIAATSLSVQLSQRNPDGTVWLPCFQ
jgi:hypothetical protein